MKSKAWIKEQIKVLILLKNRPLIALKKYCKVKNLIERILKKICIKLKLIYL